MVDTPAHQTVGSKLLNGVLWIGVGRIAANILGILSTFILARLLTPSDFGLVAIAISVVGILSVVSELSLSAALVHLPKVEEEHFHTAWTFNFIRGVLLAGIVLIASFIVAYVYQQPALKELLMALSVSVVIGSLYNPKLILFNKDLVFWQESVVAIAGKLASFSAAVLIAYLYQSYWALVLGYIASQAISTLSSYWLKPYIPKISFSKYKDLLSFSVWLSLGRLVQAVAWRSDPILLGFFMPVSSLGLISVGQRFSNLIIQEIMQPVGQVLFPAFSKMQTQTERLRSTYLRSTGMMCLVSFPIGFGTALVADPFVRIFLGEQWIAVIPILQAWVIATTWSTIQRAQPLAMAVGQTKSLFFRDCFVLLFRVPCILLGLYIGDATGFGLVYGAVAGHLLSEIINVNWSMRLIANISGATIARQYRSVIAPIVGVCGMAGLVALFNFYTQEMPWFSSDFRVLASNALVGAVAYAATLSVFWILRGRPHGPEVELTKLMARGANRILADLKRRMTLMSAKGEHRVD